MTRRLLPALALSVLVALPSAAFAAQAPLHPASGDASSSFKGVPGSLAKKKSKKKRKGDPKAPVIKKVSPRSAKVGDLLVIKGKNFRKGKRKNRVAFYTRKGGAAFARDSGASKKRLKVRIPAKLAALLPANGERARIILRVRGRRLGKRSAARISPLIAITPQQVGGDTGGGNPAPIGCAPKYGDPMSDVDRDLITDGRERDLALNACNRDSDGDGASDGYEYNSALHLNSTPVQARPYPWKRPYPNPLFKDADVDYDGDGLELRDEYALWTKYGASRLPLNYSDGKQVTVATAAPASPVLDYMDMDGSGVLSDDERDADGDYLTNWDESHGRLIPEWWEAKYDGTNGVLETPYPITFAGPSMVDPDSDGDGVHDGADDQDFDELTNMFEVQRPSDWAFTHIAIGPGVNVHNFDGVAVVDPDPVAAGNQARYYSRVNPFNPCKPVYSDNCHQHPNFGYYSPDEAWMGFRSPPAPGATPGEI